MPSHRGPSSHNEDHDMESGEIPPDEQISEYVADAEVANDDEMRDDGDQEETQREEQVTKRQRIEEVIDNRKVGEIYSPPRIVAAAGKCGLDQGTSFDLRTIDEDDGERSVISDWKRKERTRDESCGRNDQHCSLAAQTADCSPYCRT